jgi:alanine racemase
MRGHRAWAEIDLAAFRHNLHVVSSAIEPHTRLMAVLKANAYGHGAVPIAYQAMNGGASMLGVGDSTEALELRDSGIVAPLLTLGAIVEDEIPRLVEYDVHVAVHSKDLLSHLDREARRLARVLQVHLKINTGMNRLGISPEGALDVARAIVNFPNLRLRGVFTHLSSVASGDVDATREQLAVFRRVIDQLRRQGLLDLESCILHAANSAGLFALPESHFDMVRPGIALYGVVPDALGPVRTTLRPVLSLKTQIAYLRSVPAGSPIGYDHRHVTARDTLVATCTIGYDDGYPYALAGQGHALVRGRRVPVAGTVTMEYIMLDVGAVPDVQVGDEVTLVGRDGDESITLQEVARSASTIPYEISCRLGRRIKRIYVDGEQGTELKGGVKELVSRLSRTG